MEKLTLEKHLEKLCNEEKDYEILHSIWSLNKTNLSKGLKLIPSIYPNYSAHDETHSNKIIDNIELLLGEERIEKLSPTDTFLILMACYTHDIGMILTYKVIEEKWQDNKMKSTINSFAQSTDEVIANAANLILNFKKADKKESKETDKDNLQWALEVKNAVTILTAEIFRSDHAQMSSTYMIENEEFLKLADHYYWNQLPRRFKDLLANIAMLHGKDFSLIFKILNKEANGFKGDYIHPRFIACLIRLGDLLDFDDGRFNTFSIATLKSMPKISELHRQKHASVKHMLISPKAIEAELNCNTDEVYRISRNWFDMLEGEVNDQSREWTNIAPDDLGGLPPVISKDSIKILYQGVQTKPELMNLKFTISNKKIFEVLAGGAIYNEPGFVFIREIVQNALDASKIQLWKDIENGIYGSYLTKEIKDIKFPEDIDRKIYDLYPIKLEVKWKDEKRDALIVTCEDKGTGISEDSLIRMTSQVGESHKKDSNYEELISRIPFWLKPTAAFGIGMQSIFFVNNKFDVNTQYLGESAKHIIFRSAANNSYISITSDQIKMKRGTQISVEIPGNRFKELFGGSTNIILLNKFNPLENPDDDLYLTKIDDFVDQTFQYNRLIPIKYKSYNYDKTFGTTKGNKEEGNKKENIIKTTSNYQITKRENYAVIHYSIAEAIYGSIIKINFYKSEGINGFESKLLLREIPISNSNLNYYALNYMNLTWNLCNPDSDKIVNLSRDRLIPKGYDEITEKLLFNLLPKFLPIIESDLAKSISDKKDEETKNKLKKQYFNLALSLYTLAGNEYTNIKKDLLDNPIVPVNGVTDNKGKIINAKTFFDSEQFVICDIYNPITIHNANEEPEDNKKSTYIPEIQTYNPTDNIIWSLYFLIPALRNHFQCTKIYSFKKNKLIYLIKKFTTKEEIISSVDYGINQKGKKTLQSYIYNTFCRAPFTANRPCIYGITKYNNIIIKPYFITGVENYPPFSSSIIFSPFSSQEEISKWCKAVDSKNEDTQKSFIYDHLKDHLAKALTEVIKKYNIQETKVSDEDIYTSYTELLLDFYKGYQENKNEKQINKTL